MKKKLLLLCFGLILNVFSGCFSNDSGTTEDKLDSNAHYYSDGEVITYVKNQNDETKAINVIIMGDGYIKSDLKEGGIYETEAKRLIEGFFSMAPFKEYRENFNVYIVNCESTDRGADYLPGTGTINGVFNANYGEYGMDRLLVIKNEAKVKEYIEKTGLTSKNSLQKNILLISVNDTKYGGSGGSNFAVVSRNEYSMTVGVHEIAHSFAAIGDEYDYGENMPREDAVNYANVDLTNDLKKIKWSHFIGVTGYDEVGAYEGAMYYKTGVWRPTNICLMNSLAEPLCPVCREEIVKKIDVCIGKDYSFAEFIEKDKVNLKAVKTIKKKDNKEIEMFFDNINLLKR